MPGSTFGTIFRVTTFGESHGPALGAVIDGCPAGLALSPDTIRPYMERRKPGQTRYSTPRKEADEIELLSGIFEGRTTGTPICILIRNTSQRSADYSEIASCYRPGHADYSFDAKYGFRDYRGGGRSSGRETAARVAAGAVAAALLHEFGIDVLAYTASIGPICLTPDLREDVTREDVMESPLYFPEPEASARAEAFLQSCMEERDSAGGTIECRITGLPAGLGEPVFDKFDALLSQAVLSVGAVKGIEIGDGFGVCGRKGSENNDCFCSEPGPIIGKRTNHAGGILGGISDGSTVFLRAAVKPTPSVSKKQTTVNRDGREIEISVKGRHDPVIVPRAVVVVEAMAALTAADLLLLNASARLDSLKKLYLG